MMKMRNNKNSYKDFGRVYCEQCLQCIKEATYACELIIRDGRCKNFKHTSEDKRLK